MDVQDGEVCRWRQRAAGLGQGDCLGTVTTLYSGHLPLLFLAVPTFFVLSTPERQSFLWPAAAALLPALLTGFTLSMTRGDHFGSSLATLSDKGITTIGHLFPWAMMSWFAVDERKGLFRLYGWADPRPLVLVLNPPTELFLPVLAELRKHVSMQAPREAVPWQRSEAAWVVRLTGVFLLGCAVALGACVIADRNLACVAITLAFPLLYFYFCRLTGRASGVTPPGGGPCPQRVVR